MLPYDGMTRIRFKGCVSLRTLHARRPLAEVLN